MKNAGRTDSPTDKVRVADDFFERQIVVKDLKTLMGVNAKQVKAELQLLSAAWEKNYSPDQLQLDFESRNPTFLAHWTRHRRVFGYTLRAEMVYQVKEALESDASFRLESDFEHLIVDEY